MIDEVNLLLENIINKLMKEFKSNKDNLEEENEEQNEGQAKLIEEVPEMNDASKIIKDAYAQIKKNIQETDKVSARVQKLFMPWKDFLYFYSFSSWFFIYVFFFSHNTYFNINDIFICIRKR